MKYQMLETKGVKGYAILSLLNGPELGAFFDSLLQLMPLELVPPVADETPTQKQCLALGITNAELEVVLEHVDILSDIIRKTQKTEETRRLAELDTQRDRLISFLFNVVDSRRFSPLEEEKAIAESLSIPIQPYRGMQKAADEQESALIRGLQTDLAKGDFPDQLEKFGLTQVLKELGEINEQYALITNERNQKRTEVKNIGTLKEIRPVLIKDFEYIVAMAQAKYMLEQTEEASKFIDDANMLLDRMQANYNTRRAQIKGAEK